MEQIIKMYDSPVFHIVIDNCFDNSINQKIYDHVLLLKDYFQHGTINIKNQLNQNYRTNYTCYIDEIYDLRSDVKYFINDRALVKKHMRRKSPLLKAFDNFIQSDKIKRILDSTPSPFYKFRDFNYWDIQVSRYGDDNQFYTWHIDKMIDSSNPHKRILSLVYYFHGNPKRFRGGELCLTNGLYYDGKIVADGLIKEIEPKNNRLVIFNSRSVHCVKPTISPQDFPSGRFSANIWIGINNSNFTEKKTIES